MNPSQIIYNDHGSPSPPRPEGRFKSSLVDSERYLLTCMRYIELNPVRAGMAGDPGDYRWSSYRPHVAESLVNWLTEPEEYRRLAARPEARAMAYRELFKQPLATYDLEAIRTHLHKNCALGSCNFQDAMEAMACRRAKIAPQGRLKQLAERGRKVT